MSEATPVEGGQGAAPAAAPAAPSSTAAALSAPAAASAPAAPASQQLATPAVPANPQIAWLGDGVDETTLGYVANKGWDTPDKVVKSYQNLEKLLGADKAGNAIVIPKADADPKEWAAVYDRLGRPSDPSGYKVDVPQGGNAELQKAVLTKAHELGLTKAQAEGLVGWYNEQGAQAMQAQEAAKQQAFVQDDAKVKQEWGQAYTQNLAQAQAAMRGLGLTPELVDKLSDSLGHYQTMNLLQKIGSKAMEADFVGGEGRTAFGNAMTPAQAKAEIATLQADKSFTAKYLAGDAEAKAKMLRLHEMAYPA